MKFINLLPDLPYPPFCLKENLQHQHELCCNKFQHWSLAATRRKLIVSYWLKTFLQHFCFIILIPSLLILISGFGRSPEPLLVSLLPVSVICFCILFITMYFPDFYAQFLPHLDSCIESYQGQQLEGVQQCKKAQYSVVSLMLIQQVYKHLTGIESGSISTENSKLLARQYGVSEKSIGNALQLILRREWDRKSIRKRTEIINDFADARDYFEKLNCVAALIFLDQLQTKILAST